MRINILLTLLLVGIFNLFDCIEWNYGVNGPDVWRKRFLDCNGRYQSPINIITSDAVYNKHLNDILFQNYDVNLFFNVTNDGRTIIATKLALHDASLIPFIYGSDFKKEKYYFEQFHFHWGYNDFQGSEHYINDEKFPLELHLVHKSKGGDLAVLGVLFEISDEDNPNLESLLNIVSISNNSNSFYLLKISLASIIPDLSAISSSGYFRYIGSLTTPPCTENVIWTILYAKMKISSKQMSTFRSSTIKTNFREPQKLYTRFVMSSMKLDEQRFIKKY